MTTSAFTPNKTGKDEICIKEEMFPRVKSQVTIEIKMFHVPVISFNTITDSTALSALAPDDITNENINH